MKKRLYIRYFNSHDTEVPINSAYVLEENVNMANQARILRDYGINIAVHLDQHPNGKVDFVWLNC